MKLWPRVLQDRPFMRMPEPMRLLAYELILVAGAEDCDNGVLPGLEDINWHLRRDDLERDLRQLAERWDGLEYKDGHWVLVNFDRFQEAPSTKRTREWRERHGDAESDGHGDAESDGARDVPEDRSRSTEEEADGARARAREAAASPCTVREVELYFESKEVPDSARHAREFVDFWEARSWTYQPKKGPPKRITPDTWIRHAVTWKAKIGEFGGSRSLARTNGWISTEDAKALAMRRQKTDWRCELGNPQYFEHRKTDGRMEWRPLFS